MKAAFMRQTVSLRAENLREPCVSSSFRWQRWMLEAPKYSRKRSWFSWQPPMPLKPGYSRNPKRPCPSSFQHPDSRHILCCERNDVAFLEYPRNIFHYQLNDVRFLEYPSSRRIHRCQPNNIPRVAVIQIPWQDLVTYPYQKIHPEITVFDAVDCLKIID